MIKSTNEIRQGFRDFFVNKGHQSVSTGSLVPHDDPTLLFTNAGMNQFKDTYLGTEKRAYTRATSSQCCVRAGGKHNDLDNVGYTARHHTFFEMLGNFSFGDYFKREAIGFAWEYLTVELGLPKDKLWVTVFDEDLEAEKIWIEEIGVDPKCVLRIGAKDNFWSMGDTGPCGPCSEIFYDHGEDVWGGPPGTAEEDGDRFIEIWNIVFMQYNRHADGTMENLPKPSVDTGMGLERISAIMQNCHSNYEIDLFQGLIKKVAEVTGASDLEDKSLRVVADHIRSCGFLICDGVMPSNEGRGYVLRRIIRRAVRHGHKLGAKDIFFFKIYDELINQMGDAYPELSKQRLFVEKILRREEEQFAKTLDRGLQILDNELDHLEGQVIPGDVVFKLYDTFGFPADLTADIARERGLTIDEAGFDKAMAEQRKRAQQANNFGIDYNKTLIIDQKTEFIGYETLQGAATVTHLVVEGAFVNALKEGDSGQVILSATPFYAEAGGQSGDAGKLILNNGVFVVTDTKKSGDAFVHSGYVGMGSVKVNDKVHAEVDTARRQSIALHHSATHLLHAALRKTLGEHVTQKGSLVDADKLRFDFSHFEALSADSLSEVTFLVNEAIRNNYEVVTKLMDIEEAKSSNAMALFGEKYDEMVRVVQMGDFSTELCGGTHAKRTGDLGLFLIRSESGIAAGVRRIEATVGSAADQVISELLYEVDKACGLVRGDHVNLGEKIEQLVDRSKLLEKEVAELKAKIASAAGANLIDNAIEINGVKVVIANIEGIDPKLLRDSVDQMKNKMQSGIVVLATVAADDKVSLIAGVSKDLIKKVKAGELVNLVAGPVGGKGGGRPDMAMAGGNNPAALADALALVAPWLSERL
ncbi:alanyl-tRNA synthetase [Psychromonas ingrahamii 37]|uniref:Alanine--tRNA ligase n=1 Tax=Psychromonas ingrahamii (strain DSM 17664 / CCUG 51855 / 37) TaxID=357804 RepID=SYA_PSYIN|nr:alanine--tRNA ligase [Psychromonas ingrahamii]A1T001.1 RecName: Full=Alanine--tRNA ligase; AltName: Full=Alanyl-tRNA synthetase; Short=AlaRS [Psychromonas ingrahamii 37]ABM05066.1 alanyl-tRNA synthetase [Psychromonas ingrahamii 37]